MFSQIKFVLRRRFLSLSALFILGLYLDQLMMQQIEIELSNPDGPGLRLFSFGVLSFLWSLTYPLFGLFLILTALSNEAVKTSLLQKASYAVKEMLRVWGKTLSWSLLFIFPGVLRYIQLVLTPFVVILDPAYSRGEVDAIQTSTRLTRPHRGTIALILVVFVAVIPSSLAVFDDFRSFQDSLLTAILFSLIEMMLTLFLSILFYRIYQRSLHESHVQLEGS